MQHAVSRVLAESESLDGRLPAVPPGDRRGPGVGAGRLVEGGRRATALHCRGVWHAPGGRRRRLRRGDCAGATFAAGRGAAGAGLGDGRADLDRGRRPATSGAAARRARRGGGPARGLRLPGPGRRRGARRARILLPQRAPARTRTCCGPSRRSATRSASSWSGSGPRRRCGSPSGPSPRPSVGITISDARRPDEPIIYVNPAFTPITGYAGRRGPRAQLPVPPGPRDRPRRRSAEIRAALNERRECRVTLKNYRKDGTPFWNELAISPVLDAGGPADPLHRRPEGRHRGAAGARRRSGSATSSCRGSSSRSPTRSPSWTARGGSPT